MASWDWLYLSPEEMLRKKREEEAANNGAINAEMEREKQQEIWAAEDREKNRLAQSNAIDVTRNNAMAGAGRMAPVPTEQPRAYVDQQKRNLTPAPRVIEDRPILAVEEEDEVVDPTPSPLTYVMTGETNGTKTIDDPESGGLWKFFGYNTQDERNSASNGLMRAAGAMLGSTEGDVFRTIGKGMEGYATEYDKSLDTYSKRQLDQQRLRANELSLAEGEKTKAINAQIARIYQDAGPSGLTPAQKQQVAALYAEAGDIKSAQAIIGGTATEKTAEIREYEYAKQGGYTGSFADYQARKTGGSKKSTDLQADLDRINEERIAAGKPAYSMEDYQQQQNRAASDTKFAEKSGEENAKMFKEMTEAGFNAQSDLANIDVLDNALKQTPGGLTNIVTNAANQWGLGNLVSEGADSVQVANAMISKLTPMQRPPGSGAASDADMRLFRESLPTLAGTPEGNQIVVTTMRGLATHKQALGTIAARAQSGEITQSEALRQMRELPDPLAEFKKVTQQQNQQKRDANAPLGPRPPSITLPSGRSIMSRG
ncbi:hypothetical protein G6L37_11870 [Agrobacterium rubi]|uniref:hypothetical protein n=1 Tax=Agrobacterium rubi TaxID=28099 RepID=UPI001574E6CD|nr:hypothetical protein [Agrobacterium rubi]NTF06859.1 hypothetical protein [Agrobacterium rubi]NTF19101.1 hypothetical protein [Agrobacterium rubi]NTF26064.1 hypothetical protein [Agrobacterium rubi]